MSIKTANCRVGTGRLALVGVVAGLLALGACGKAGGDGAAAPLTEEAAVARAQAALGPFKKAIKGALIKGLADGPGAAVTACRDEAPKLAAAASVAGVEVGRTSQRLRSPANAPRPWMAPLLAELAKEPRAAGLHRAVPLDGGRWGYVEPIYIEGLCLTCHGETVPAEVEQRLASLYPDDHARGYADGDLRGLFWVEVSPTPAP